MSYVPTGQQWRGWSLPSKLTAIGTLASMIALAAYIVEKGLALEGLLHHEPQVENHAVLDRAAIEKVLIDVAMRQGFTTDAIKNLKILVEAGVLSDPNGVIRALPDSPSPDRIALAVRLRDPGGNAMIDLAHRRPVVLQWRSTGAMACGMETPSGRSGASLVGEMTLPHQPPLVPTAWNDPAHLLLLHERNKFGVRPCSAGRRAEIDSLGRSDA